MSSLPRSDTCGFFLVLWFDITYTQIHIHTHKFTRHTQGPKDWHSHIKTFSHHLIYAHSNYLCYIEQFTDIKNLLSTMSFVLNNYSLVGVLYLLIKYNKTYIFLWSTNNTHRNGENKQNTQTPNTQRKITLENGKGYLVRK